MFLNNFGVTGKLCLIEVDKPFLYTRKKLNEIVQAKHLAQHGTNIKRPRNSAIL